jgi:hypothetical protein
MVPVGIAGVAPGIGIVPGTVVGVAPGTVVVVVVPGTVVVGVAPGMVVDFWLRSRDGYMFIQQQRNRSVFTCSVVRTKALRANGK